MRKFGMFVALLCAGAFFATQAPLAAKAKTVKDQVSISSDLKVGSTVLKAGDYQVTSDGKTVTFQELVRSVDNSAQRVDKGFKPVSVPCSTKPLDKKSEHTQLDTTADSGGSTVLRGLTIRGSDVSYSVTN